MGVLDLPVGLASTVALLDAASDPRVSSKRIRWGSMERVLQMLRGPFKESDANPMAVREVNVASLAWSWARTCMDGPVPPSHASTGLERLRMELDAAIEHVGSSRLVRLKDAIEHVAAGEHPAAEAVVDIVMSLPVDEEARPACVLIVRGDGLLGVAEWAKGEGLHVDVATANQARRALPWQAAVVFGPPDRYASSPWVAGKQAAATAGWLLTAPPAPVVTVLSWTGHRPLDKAAYQPWEGAPQSTVTEAETVEVIEDDFLPDSFDTFRPAAAPTFSHDEDSVAAFGLQFLVNSAPVLAYFHPEIGPKPVVVSFEDGHALVTRTGLRATRVGRCLMFRTSIAGKDALDRATSEWLAVHRKGFNAAVAEKLRQDLKDATRAKRDQIGSHGLIELLRAEGLDRSYAQTLPTRMLHPDFIAPQHQDTYLRVCRALGLRPDAKSFGLLRTLRTARRQAGLSLSAKVAARLDLLPDLPDVLRDDGAVVLRDSGLEGVALLVVRSVSTEPVDVPTWRLGMALDEGGHTWHP